MKHSMKLFALILLLIILGLQTVNGEDSGPVPVSNKATGSNPSRSVLPVEKILLNSGPSLEVDSAGAILTIGSDTDGDGFTDGLEIEAGTDPGDITDPQSVTPGQVKLIQDGQKVGISRLVSTATLDDKTYAQAEDRSGSIILDGVSIPSGSIVDVIGIVALTAEGDRCLSGCTYRMGLMTTATPVAMSNKTLGGAAMGYQEGVADGFGLNNIGLFIKTWGRVSYVDPGGNFIYIDDGSGCNDGNSFGEGGSAVIGVRFIFPASTTPPALGRHITAVGISSTCKVNGVKVRAVRLRSGVDIDDIVYVSGVINTVDGAALEGVLVSTDYGSNSTHTDSSGRYELCIPYFWSGTVTASKDGFTFEPTSRSYSDLASDVSDQNYTAMPLPAISGRVRTADGQPVAGVEIYNTSNGTYAYSDENGFYRTYVPMGWNGTISAYKYRYAIQPPSRTYEIVTADTADQDYTATPYLAISGYVLTAEGNPVESIELYADHVGEWTRPDSTGYYALYVPPGWSGTVSTWTYLWTVDPPTRTYENVTADITDQNYTAIPDVYISGYVRTADGQPVAEVAVQDNYYSNYTYTDQNGYYKLDVPMGWSGTIDLYKYHCKIEPSSRTCANVTADMTDQNYTATPYPVISGYVRTTEGTPVEYVAVQAVSAGEYTSTGYNGYYALYVPPGWSGTVSTNANLWTTDPPTRTYENVTTDIPDQNYTALPHVYISGHVKTASGEPVVNVVIRDEANTFCVYTEEDGYYRANVPNGWSGTLTASKDLCAMVPESRTYENVTADIADQDYTVTPYPVISGYVRTTSGDPVARVYLDCGLGFYSTLTDQDGYYSLPVPSGWSGTIIADPYQNDYTLSPPSRTYENVTSDITEQNYTAVPYPAISGYVRTASGDPLVNAVIRAEGYNRYVYTDQNGFYSLGMPPGWSGTVTASMDNYTMEPPQRTYTNVTGDITDQDYTAVSSSFNP